MIRLFVRVILIPFSFCLSFSCCSTQEIIHSTEFDRNVEILNVRENDRLQALQKIASSKDSRAIHVLLKELDQSDNHPWFTTQVCGAMEYLYDVNPPEDMAIVNKTLTKMAHCFSYQVTDREWQGNIVTFSRNVILNHPETESILEMLLGSDFLGDDTYIDWTLRTLSLADLNNTLFLVLLSYRKNALKERTHTRVANHLNNVLQHEFKSDMRIETTPAKQIWDTLKKNLPPQKVPPGKSIRELESKLKN